MSGRYARHKTYEIRLSSLRELCLGLGTYGGIYDPVSETYPSHQYHKAAVDIPGESVPVRT